MLHKINWNKKNYYIWLIISIILISFTVVFILNEQYKSRQQINVQLNNLAINELAKLSIKSPAESSSYSRDKFYKSWDKWGNCNIRQKILNRDVSNRQLGQDGCSVISGTLHDPYTGKTIELKNKSDVAKLVQIDHVVALSDAWKTGAQNLNADQRHQLAIDDLELIAVSSQSNQDKSDSNAADWLPSNHKFRCQYVARQIAVKIKYSLWLIQAEYDRMKSILSSCPDQTMPTK